MIEQDQTNKNYSFQDDSIDFKELLNLIWEGKKLIIIVTAVAALGSVLIALNLTNYYKSQTVLTTAEGSNETASLSRYNNFASLAGINLASSGIDKGSLIVNTIMSTAFLKHLLSFEDVLPSIMAAKSYDIETKKLVFDSDLYDVTNKTWFNAKPSYIETYEVYMKQLTVSYDSNLGLIHVHTEHLSPIFAKDFLDLIIKEADTLLRQKDLKQSSDALDYLLSEISKTSLVEIKSSMNQLIQSQLETQMMAKISTDYALMVIEPPFIPEKKFKPSRSLISLLGTIFGLVIGILWVLRQHYFALNNIEQRPGS